MSVLLAVLGHRSPGRPNGLLAHLEEARPVPQRVAEQAVARRAARQRAAQHGAVGQHEAAQQLEVMLARFVRHVDRAARHGTRHAVQHRRRVHALRFGVGGGGADGKLIAFKSKVVGCTLG